MRCRAVTNRVITSRVKPECRSSFRLVTKFSSTTTG